MTRPIDTPLRLASEPAAAAADNPGVGGDARRRVIVERVQPEIDGGRFPITRTPGESVRVTADVFADGHDLLAGVVKFRYVPPGSKDRVHKGNVASRRAGPVDPPPWNEIPLVEIGDDSWTATFPVTELGEYQYTVEAWVDRFGSWLKGLIAKFAAQQDVSSELLEGAELVQTAAGRLKPAPTYDNADRLQPASTYDNADRLQPASTYDNAGRLKPAPTSDSFATTGTEVGATDIDVGTTDVEVGAGFSRPDDGLRLLEIADKLRGPLPLAARVAAARDPELRALMSARADRRTATTYDKSLRVLVDPARARFSAWYEMFPRSCTTDPLHPGTLRDAEAHLPRIADLGFDVLYLPPIHPIGHTHRKGRNNTLTPSHSDPGSPWAIGSEDGGHTAIDPALGTLADFDRFVALATRLGLGVALDIAFQASPDHPWVREHPEWFRHRPDGSIKYAENPPKKYQDIYPIDFETSEWRPLWAALRDVFLFWMSHGVTIFRVDNPHTKSFRFWEWAIAEIKRDHPEAIFLAEAFTRPKLMRYLAKAGFSQSYMYFTWRNSAHELRDYVTELTTSELREYMRPNFFANTPDILHEYLQTGGRPAFEVRFILAATLSASYGIYSGFELCENIPVRPGSEEYLDSEKYEIRPRDWTHAGRLNEMIARVNEIRRQHPALQFNHTLRFHESDNGAFLWFSKRAPGPLREITPGPLRAARPPGDRVFVVANTDPFWMQHGWVRLPIEELGIGPRQSYIVEDLLDGARYPWRGAWNYVKLEPAHRVAHILVVRS